jgi:hypothetical protein
MKEYGEVESWTQVLIEPTTPKPLGFTTGGEVVWQTESGIAFYDPKKPKIMNHSVEGRYCFAGSYVESLVLLDPRKRGSKKGNRRATNQKRVTHHHMHLWVGVPSYVRDPPSHAPLCTKDSIQGKRKKKK